MIQRVQSIYLGICILLLLSLFFGVEVVTFSSEAMTYQLSAIKTTKIDPTTGETLSSSFHFGIAIIGVLLLSAVATLLQFKNLKKQFKLGRSLFFTYFVILLFATLFISLGGNWIDGEVTTREIGLGFLLFVAGFPFTFLANIGIKRDRSLLDSLDRLR
ncbi:MAG: DUF4293 domain-containing protein [Crocinitomicaceae bacterium]|nr:DUF4293 domain-containing protein [Crocinitomicaceae bacterium]